MYNEFEFFEANDFEGKQKDGILKFSTCSKKINSDSENF